MQLLDTLAYHRYIVPILTFHALSKLIVESEFDGLKTKSSELFAQENALHHLWFYIRIQRFNIIICNN